MRRFHINHPLSLSLSLSLSQSNHHQTSKRSHIIIIQLMKNSGTSCYNKVAESDALRRQTFGIRLKSDGEDNSFTFNNTVERSPNVRDRETTPPSQANFCYNSTPSLPSFQCTPTPSSAILSPIDQSFSSSPALHSPWTCHMAMESDHQTRLIGTLLRREGHIYSLATSGDLLYTGSESKSIRVWKNNKEFSGFKSNSGLVKAIIIAGDRIFSGHQDGKIRIWKPSHKDPTLHKRIGTLPTFRAKFKGSFNPNNYVEARKAIWFKHTDAISSLSLSEDKSLLYSASWDTTFKVWRISDSKCLESVDAHNDTVNSIISTFDALVFTGSADGTVKVWRRQVQGKGTKHYLSQTLLKQECAVTSLAVDQSSKFLYCGSSDGVVNFWETDKFICHGGVLKGHKLAVLCLATSGNLVFTGSADTNICVWRRDEGVHIYLTVLTGHTGPVKCMAAVEEKGGFQSSGDRHYIVYSGSIDKSVKIWKVLAQAVAVESPPSPSLQQQQQHQVENYRASQNFLTGFMHAR